MARPRKSPRTPDSRAERLRQDAAKARKKYHVDVKKRKKFEFEGEEEITKDMLVILRLGGYSNTQIAMILGISRGQVKTYLGDGNLQKKYVRLKEKLPQAAIELAQSYLIEAVTAVVHVMRTTEDEALVLKAAGELFDRFGIPKSSRVESTSKDDENPVDNSLMERLRRASPEVQAAASELHEALNEGLEQLLGKEIPHGNSE